LRMAAFPGLAPVKADNPCGFAAARRGRAVSCPPQSPSCSSRCSCPSLFPERGAAAAARPSPRNRGAPAPRRGERQRRRAKQVDIVQFDRSDILVNKQVGSLSLQVWNEADASSRPYFEDVGGATVRIYTGELACSGAYQGSEVILKEYPFVRGQSFSSLAKNEVSAHARAQASEENCENICLLLGTYEGRIGERWLVFDSSCIYPVSYWAGLASKKSVRKQKNWSLLTLIDPEIDRHRRQAFILSILKGSLKGLASLHKNDLLHQNLGPDSIVLSSVDEKQVRGLRVKLRELSFSVSVSEASLRGGGTLAELWQQSANRDENYEGVNIREEHEQDLWRRATQSGCSSYFQKKNFGIADDIYQLGLVVMYVIFKSASDPDTVFDMVTLKRYVDITFAGSIGEDFRAFLEADETFQDTIAWLDEHEGWALLEAMLHQDWKQRPTAESCLLHPFLQQTLKYQYSQ